MAPRTIVDERVSAQLYWHLYEAAEARLISRWLPEALPTVELGASLGAISCIIKRRIRGQMFVAVEADSRLAELALANLRANRLDGACVVENAAIAYRRFEEEIFDNDPFGFTALRDVYR